MVSIEAGSDIDLSQQEKVQGRADFLFEFIVGIDPEMLGQIQKRSPWTPAGQMIAYQTEFFVTIGMVLGQPNRFLSIWIPCPHFDLPYECIHAVMT